MHAAPHDGRDADVGPTTHPLNVPTAALCGLAGSAIAFVITALLTPFLTRGENVYPDLIVSEAAGYPKNGDFLVVGTFCVMTLVATAAIAITIPGRRFADGVVTWLASKLAGTPTSLVLPSAVFSLLALVVSLQLPREQTLGWLAIAGIVVGAAVVSRRWEPGRQADLLVLTAVGFFSALASVTALAMLVPSVAGAGDDPALAAAGTLLLGLCVVAATVLTDPSRPDAARRAALVAQCLLPLGLLGYARSFARLGSQTYTLTPPGWFSASVLIVTLILIVVFGRHLRHGWREGPAAARRCVRPAAVALVGVAMATLPIAPSIGYVGDWISAGENAIQRPQIATFEAAPYEGFIPYPGLSGYVYGTVNTALGDTAGSFPRATTLVVASIVAAIALLLARSIGAARALVLLVPLASGLLYSAYPGDRFLYVALTAALLAQRELWSRPPLWLAVLLSACLVNVVVMPAIGIPAVMAAVPIAVLQISRWRVGTSEGRRWGVVVGASACLLIGVALLPLAGATLAYAVEEGQTNSLVWGQPLLPHTSGRGGFVAAVESVLTMRASAWTLALPIFSALAIRRLRGGPTGERVRGWTAVSGGVFALAMIPYAFGRTDIRPLATSLFVAGFLLPTWILTTRSDAVRIRPLVLLVVALAWSVTASSGLVGMATLVRASTATFTSDEPASVLAGNHVPTALRDVPIDADAARALRSLLDILDVLAPGDARVLLLSNDQRTYVYLGREAPSVAAHLYAGTRERQEDMVRLIEEAIPSLVVVPVRDDDGIFSLRLRTYRVYRALLESTVYRMFRTDASLVLVRDDVAERAQALFGRPGEPASGLAAALRPAPLHAELPSADWGASWSSLRDRFDATPLEGTERDTTPDGDHLVWAPPARLDGTDADFLLLRVGCAAPGTDGPIPVRIDADGAPGIVVSAVDGGRALVPVGAVPGWLDGGAPTLSLAPVAGCPPAAFSIEIEAVARLVDRP